MATIPWWIWIGVGLFVALVSAQLSTKLTLFIWIGVLFILIGIGKAIAVVILTPKEQKKIAATPYPHKPTPFTHTLYCPRCRVAINTHDNFCKFCGMQLRGRPFG